mmetsp:Transcript_32484/g.87223  ORF Transcript_32484/g.87223 Transcript_32484/m.87223 type:complete len:249 (-) Transcript_32484:313-1059(-)
MHSIVGARTTWISFFQAAAWDVEAPHAQLRLVRVNRNLVRVEKHEVQNPKFSSQDKDLSDVEAERNTPPRPTAPITDGVLLIPRHKVVAHEGLDKIRLLSPELGICRFFGALPLPTCRKLKKPPGWWCGRSDCISVTPLWAPVLRSGSRGIRGNGMQRCHFDVWPCASANLLRQAVSGTRPKSSMLTCLLHDGLDVDILVGQVEGCPQIQRALIVALRSEAKSFDDDRIHLHSVTMTNGLDHRKKCQP